MKNFGDRYEILKILGNGAMGCVYLAHDKKLDRKVALKTPTFDRENPPRWIQRFEREAQSAARLVHPYVCTVFDFGQIDGTAFITMEFVEGRPLSHIIANRLLPARTAARICVKIAQGMAHAHENDVVHRDIKPDNIMVDGKFNPRIMDFGLALQADQTQDSRKTRDGDILGTPAYMSPEQVEGQITNIGPRIDIYALGVVLYEMLTGTLPFTGPVTSVLARVLTEMPPDPREIRPEIDPALAELCLRMMAKSPADRPHSMTAVAKLLQNYLKQEHQNRSTAKNQSTDTTQCPKSGSASDDLAMLAFLKRPVDASPDDESLSIEQESSQSSAAPSSRIREAQASTTAIIKKYGLMTSIGCLLLLFVIIFITRASSVEVEPPEVNAEPIVVEAEQEQSNENSTSQDSNFVGGIDEAMDLITRRIAQSLNEHPTFVIWVFDSSLSLKSRRNEIRNRLESSYRQLQLVAEISQHALKNSVVSFGEFTQFGTPEPVVDVHELTTSIGAIKIDDSGIENAFSAVKASIERWQTRQDQMDSDVILVIVTDERGDDTHLLEETIAQSRDAGVTCYCIGRDAPLGRETIKVEWRDRGKTYRIPISTGPESQEIERLNIDFWDDKPMPEGLTSGFGPYALARLCHETNGTYLIIRDNGDNSPRFDTSVMRRYFPDYCSSTDYQNELNINRAKGALVEIAKQFKDKAITMPPLAFPANSEARLRTALTNAQKSAAVLQAKLNDEMLKVILQGESDRATLVSPRWKASYDLAVGRLAAMVTRLHQYDCRLTELLSRMDLHKDSDSDPRKLIPAADLPRHPEIQEYAKIAEEYLRRVINEHPGTPWAYLAERELSQDFSWKWETHDDNSVGSAN